MWEMRQLPQFLQTFGAIVWFLCVIATSTLKAFFFFFLLFFLRPGENALEDKFIILSRYEMKDERSHFQYTYFNAHSIHCCVSPHMVLIALLKL